MQTGYFSERFQTRLQRNGRNHKMLKTAHEVESSENITMQLGHPSIQMPVHSHCYNLQSFSVHLCDFISKVTDSTDLWPGMWTASFWKCVINAKMEIHKYSLEILSSKPGFKIIRIFIRWIQWMLKI